MTYAEKNPISAYEWIIVTHKKHWALSVIKQWVFSRESPKSKDMGNLQRLSPRGRVKPQANGGRKIPLLFQ